jgi:MFS family permease
MLILRLLLGISCGFYIPAALSLIEDYYPEQSRMKAIAFVSIGVIFGISANQLSSTFVNIFGWRNYYKYLGLFWTTVGIVGYFVLKEPVRGTFSYWSKSDD